VVGEAQGVGCSGAASRGRSGVDFAQHRVTVATLTEWRQRFLAGGEAMLKSGANEADDQEVKRLKSAAAVWVNKELLREKITRLENGRLLAFWMSKR
jgi:transposase